jgi:DNA-binding response OmpR family regulator
MTRKFRTIHTRKIKGGKRILPWALRPNYDKWFEDREQKLQELEKNMVYVLRVTKENKTRLDDLNKITEDLSHHLFNIPGVVHRRDEELQKFWKIHEGSDDKDNVHNSYESGLLNKKRKYNDIEGSD